MKRILAVIFVIVLGLTLLLLPAFNITGADITKEHDDKKVLKLYHVDVKSGGRNSRGSFLKSVAREYNKLQSDVFVIVEIYEQKELNAAISDSPPNIISFGSGSFPDESVLSPYGGRVSFSDDFLTAVEKNGTVYAVPWSYNAYFLVGDGDKVNYACDNSLLSLCLSGEKVALGDGFPDANGCYEAFISSKQPFIATAKEVTKIISKAERGAIELPEMTAAGGFTDMINCLGVCRESENKAEAERFIEYVTSEKVQKRLTRLNLLSPCVNGLYSTSPFKEVERQKVRALSVFDGKNYCDMAKAAIENDDEKAKSEIERLFK